VSAPEPPDASAGAREGATDRSPWSDARAWTVLLATTILGVALDLSTKWAAFRWIAPAPVRVDRAAVLALPPADIGSLIPPHEPIVLAPRLLQFQLVLNPGAVFGVGPGRRWVFMAFTLGALAFGLWMFARWTHRRDRWAHAAIGLIFAGGLGNLYDRLAFGCVRDFLHPLPVWKLPLGLRWPGGDEHLWPWVSNIADALLLIGIGLLLIRLWAADRRDARARAHAPEAPPAST